MKIGLSDQLQDGGDNGVRFEEISNRFGMQGHLPLSWIQFDKEFVTVAWNLIQHGKFHALYSQFSQREPRSPLILNENWVFLRVNRLYTMLSMPTPHTAVYKCVSDPWGLLSCSYLLLPCSIHTCYSILEQYSTPTASLPYLLPPTSTAILLWPHM